MKIDVRHADDVIIVDLKGRLVAGTGDQLLHDAINELLAAQWTKIILNLSEVARIDSSGIGELTAGVRLAERFGSEVKLIIVRGQVRDILHLSQLLPLLDIYEDEESALASFADGGDPEPGAE